ncbi:MAG: response regulator transcription factor [Candidatus Didemnitutus sp.]|nr:response regulator transcription factor [Candidatus Didemnitutus sp.]
MVAERYCLLPEPVTNRRHLFPAEPALLLTEAEGRVLELLGAGYSNKEIAARLGKAEPTVKNQVASILHKLGQPTRARLIAALR